MDIGSILQQQKQQQLMQKMPQVVSALMIIACGWSGATLFWKAVDSDISQVIVPVTTSRSNTITSSQLIDHGLDKVANQHLFGDRSKISKPVNPTPAKKIDAPETRLSLTLKGIVSNSEGAAAFALIAQGRGVEEVYKVGMMIGNQAVIREINPDHVVLDRKGNLEILKLPKDEVVGFDEPTIKESTIKNTTSPRIDTSQRISTSKYGELREQLLSNPQEMMKMARIRPVMGNGKMTGYRVDPGSDPKLFEEVGLEPGDIVTTINGISVTNPAEVGNVLNQLTTASEISVTVLRNGVAQSLSLSF